MRFSLLLTTAFMFLAPVTGSAADDLSAGERYQTVKEQTKNTGSVGFHKRRDAYKDYVLEARENDAADVADIEPAAGDEAEQNTDSQDGTKNEDSK